jgi:hypothetical protein
VDEDTSDIDRALIAEELEKVVKLARIKGQQGIAQDILNIAEKVRSNVEAHYPDPI